MNNFNFCNLGKKCTMFTIKRLAEQAGIVFDRDLKINNNDVFNRVLRSGTLGLGESYVEELWDCDNLDNLFYNIGKAGISSEDISYNDKFYLLYNWLLTFLWNPQSIENSKQVALQHYDLGNDFFSKMLDKRMIYSCAYWKSATNLDDAQSDKCRLICQKLNLSPGMTVLDIGCGWGGLAYYMAHEYNVNVVAITISEEQFKYACDKNSHHNVTYELCDYRLLNRKNQQFDAIVSVGMFEHVGYQNYREFFKIVNTVLKDDGLFLLHTIVGNKSRTSTDQWIAKYIFPNSMLPSFKQIMESSEGILIAEDVHNFGQDYDRTLMEWFYRFDTSCDGKRDTPFYRMWKYYLLSCAGMFRARRIQLSQTVFSKGKIGGYTAVR